jgi:inosine-uridine nucleoside N-ribohydrolase
MIRFIPVLLCGILIGCAAIRPSTARHASGKMKPTPVILDTDIGDDIDDTWALVMLLKSPQFDVKLITTTNGQQDYRARLVAKLLTVAGRTDIPIGLGAGESKQEQKQLPWVKDFPLSKYKGKIHKDGVAALTETVNASPEPITIIAIGPLQTLAAAVERDPGLASKVNFVGMHGGVFVGYGGAGKPQSEFNVKTNIPAAQKVFAAPWRSAAITPLDTCGLPNLCLDGERYQTLAHSKDLLVRTILENYAIWSKQPDPSKLTKTTTLYDTVAICLANPDCQPLMNIQKLKIAVTDDGITEVSPTGARIDVATSWKNLEGYRDHLVQVLLSHK